MKNTDCTSCDSCNFCNFCNSCDSCSSCNFCTSCDFCTSCTYCNFCTSCNFCISCVNLKMTECNLFCYAENKDNDGFQRPRYQVFNKQLTKNEYNKISIPYIKLDLDKDEYYKTRYKIAFNKAFQELSKEVQNKITSLPGFDPKIFKKYWGVDIESDELTLE